MSELLDITQQPSQHVEQGNSFKNASVGDYIQMGRYPQTANGDILSIEWQVLEKESKKMLVISRYSLDSMCFNSNGSQNWENSDIRKWLNGEFYNNAFNEQEKKLIINSRISTFFYKDVFFGFSMKKILIESNDHIFLLTKEDVEKYFVDESRRCKATEYTKKKGAFLGCNDFSYWWLRSARPYYRSFSVYIIDQLGRIDFFNVKYRNILVRPAMWINI